MDTNASQAIKMAGGILIAITIIATLTYSFSKFSPFQQQLEDIQALEQTADFNKEYEVYNKNLMLGIDVISAINKAYSNNVKYIEAYGYSDDIRDNYMVDIELIPKEEKITLSQTLYLKRLEIEVDNVTGKTKVVEKDIQLPDDGSDEYVFKGGEYEDRKEASNQIKTLMGINELKKIWPEDSIDKIDGRICLINETNESNYRVNQDIYDKIIKNTDLKKICNNTNDKTKQYWSKAILETYAYSLKTKKFKCTGVKLSEQTGRIIEIQFTEI